MKRVITIAFVLATLISLAQENIYLRGFVYDKDANNAPLGTAAVQIKNSQLGGLTDDNGYFEVPVPKVNLKDSLKVSYVGYVAQAMSITTYKEGDTLRVYLTSSAETKQEVVIVAMNAKGILLRAIANMKRNLLYDSLIATGFYRQSHKENGKYVRLIEADASVAFNCKSPYKYSFHELVQINKQRRAENYETNGDIHGDHIVDLLKENPYSYNKNNFLDPKKLDFYSPKITGEDSIEYVISLQYKESSSAKLERAKVWVHKETFAMTRMEIEKFPNPYYVKTRYANDSRWKLVNEKDVVETEKVNDKYVVKSITRSYNHHVLNLNTGNVDFIVEESFELYFDDFNAENAGEVLSKGRFGAFTNLYSDTYKYDDKFWNDYDALDDHPLNDDIKKDLEHAKPLTQQFVGSGK
ncbi:MAG: carboxypeptidase-like regulatory domain-containing protein [Bacteroidetes bacterium]|nr:carboxypeptidase-like regulatory domain-containing protein [Bacteroidota bacterium]